MEDSDSDVAYESADEGEELENAKIDRDMINVAGEPHNAHLAHLESLKIEEGSSTLDDEGVTIKNKDVPLKRPLSNLSQRKFMARKTPSPSPILQSSEISSLDESPASPDAESPKRLSPQEGQDVASSNDKSSHVPSHVPDSTTISEPSVATASPVCKQRRPRVPLRLEKKLQEKNRSTIKEESKRLEELSQAQISSPSYQKETPPPTLFSLQSEINNAPPSSNDEQSPSSSSWGWGSWGSSILSSAASTVSNLTTQVSQSIETVMETVEASLGVPPAEDLAHRLLTESSAKPLEQGTNEIFYPPEGKVDTEGEEESTEDEEKPTLESLPKSPQDSANQPHSSVDTHGQMNIPGVSTLTKVLENKGSLVIQSSLDALEKIGKTTYNILTEGDPGLRKKRSLLTGDSGALLSQALQEARNRPDEASPVPPAEESLSFTSILENFHGLAHMEALESLSQVAKAKFQDVSPGFCPTTAELAQELPSFEDIPDDEEDHDFEGLIQQHIDMLNLPFTTKKLVNCQQKTRKWLDTNKMELGGGIKVYHKEIYQKGVSCLAEMTAYGLEHFHRLGEYLAANSLQANITTEANNSQLWTKQLITLTQILCHELSMQALKFTQSINAQGNNLPDDNDVNALITNLFMEASSGVTFLQDAFYLLVPIVHASLPHQSCT